MSGVGWHGMGGGSGCGVATLGGDIAETHVLVHP